MKRRDKGEMGLGERGTWRQGGDGTWRKRDMETRGKWDLVKAELGEGGPELSLAMINSDLSNQRITNHESTNHESRITNHE